MVSGGCLLEARERTSIILSFSLSEESVSLESEIGRAGVGSGVGWICDSMRAAARVCAL